MNLSYFIRYMPEFIYKIIIPSQISQKDLNDHTGYFHENLFTARKWTYICIVLLIALIAVLEYYMRGVALSDILIWRGPPLIGLFFSYYGFSKNKKITSILIQFLMFALSILYLSYFQIIKNNMYGVKEYGYYILFSNFIPFLIPMRLTIYILMHAVYTYVIMLNSDVYHKVLALSYLLMLSPTYFANKSRYAILEKLSLKNKETLKMKELSLKTEFNDDINSAISTINNMSDRLDRIIVDASLRDSEKIDKMKKSIGLIQVASDKLIEVSKKSADAKNHSEHLDI